MFYLILLLLSYISFANQTNVLYNDVKYQNNAGIYTEDSMMQQSSYSESSSYANSVQNMSGYNANSLPVTPPAVEEAPEIQMEKIPLYTEPKIAKQQLFVMKPALFTHIGLGINYVRSPSVAFTESGVQTNLLAKSYTNTILPVGLELAIPVTPRAYISAGGSYVFNPFANSSNLATNGIQIFENRVRYMFYGKFLYRFTESFTGYVLGGFTGSDLSVYHDVTNTLIGKFRMTSPSFGLGGMWQVSKKAFIFVDGIYTTMGKVDYIYNGKDARTTAIIDRKYSAVQARVGLQYKLYDFTSL